MQKTFSSKIGYLPKLKLHHLTVSDDTLKIFAEEGDKSIYNQRFIIAVSSSITWRGGTVSLGNNSAYITFSKERMKQLDVHLDDTITFTLEKDTSKYGFEVPIEFEEVLRQDPHAKQRFERIRMGLQRAVIYQIIQYKSEAKRIEKSIFFLENLKISPEGETTMRHILGKDLP
ncbi:MAG: YdeI/OmpD-associated family protein [Crocinitomicaceae bacterium]|nr:YdeI/OmpD-associated family protein [Crocinitomicaceae bacterium]